MSLRRSQLKVILLYDVEDGLLVRRLLTNYKAQKRLKIKIGRAQSLHRSSSSNSLLSRLLSCFKKKKKQLLNS
jgi:hypothetical protein